LPVVAFAALAWSLHRATRNQRLPATSGYPRPAVTRDQRLPAGADQAGLVGKDDRLDAVAQA